MAKPVFLVIAGPNGAGKSTFAQDNSVGTHIDPDAIARRIDPDNPDRAVIPAGAQALRQIRDHIASGQSFTQETTLAGRQPLRDMEAARDAGFHVRLEFIALSSAFQSARRVAERVAKGGHDIPDAAIAQRFNKIAENLPAAASIADETTIRDNENKDFRVILRQRDGKTIERADNVPRHLADLVNRLETLGRDTPKSLSVETPDLYHGGSRMADDPYCYPGTNVLINKQGITDPEKATLAEQVASAKAIKDLDANPVQGKYDTAHFLEINRRIMGQSYEWAGKPRIYDMDKPEPVLGGDSVKYGHHKNITSDLDREMSALPKFQWDDKDKLTSASKFASHMTAIWKVHAFREGNTRTVGALVRQFSKERGFELDHDTLWERASETRDALAKATVGQPKDLIKTILTAHQIGKDRNHPELGRITSQTAHVLRFMGKPEITFPKQGDKVSGQVLDVSYNTVLVGNGRSVQAVSDKNFEERPATNNRVSAIISHALEPLPKTKAIERDAPIKTNADIADTKSVPSHTVLTPPKSNDRDRSR